MGPPLTESPGQCRVCERGRAGSPSGQTQPRAAWNACSGDGGNNGAASGADRRIEGGGAFQERPAVNAGRATGTSTTKKTSGPPPLGAAAVPVRDRGLKDRERLRRLWLHEEHGQDGQRETVVDAGPAPGSSRGRRNGLDIAAIDGGECRGGSCRRAAFIVPKGPRARLHAGLTSNPAASGPGRNFLAVPAGQRRCDLCAASGVDEPHSGETVARHAEPPETHEQVARVWMRVDDVAVGPSSELIAKSGALEGCSAWTRRIGMSMLNHLEPQNGALPWN